MDILLKTLMVSLLLQKTIVGAILISCETTMNEVITKHHNLLKNRSDVNVIYKSVSKDILFSS